MTNAYTDKTLDIERVDTRDAVIAATGDDIYVRSSLHAGPTVRAWRSGRGVAWFSRAPHRGYAGWLTVVAAPELVPGLVHAALEDSDGAVTGVTVPAAAFDELPDRIKPVDYNLWEWFWTSAPPPVQALEDRVEWATDADAEDIAALLDGHSPRHSARPGAAETRQWAVVRADGRTESDEAAGGADGPSRLLACGAHIEYVPGVPHLASIVTRTDARGQGLGGALTAWLTRQILAAGAPTVTLGMYGDNDSARRLYRRLGYTDSHHWASGRLAARTDAGTTKS